MKVQPTQWGHLGLGVLLFASQVVNADISGKVFRDFNVNGVADANEPGEADVVIKAFAPDGTEAASTNSDTVGSYALALAGGTEYRLEFSWSNNALKPGAGGGTSVQFVQDGTSNVDFALSNPAQTIAPGAVPQIVTAVHSGSIHFGDEFVLATIPESAGSTSSTSMNAYMTPAPTVLAKETEIGAIWGVAHDRLHQRLLAGAFIKRFTRLVGNPTTIYSVPENGGVPSVWITLDSARTDPHGAAPDWSRDFDVIPSVGKEGLGDVDMAEDGKTVYTIDLKTRELVSIPVNADGSAGIPERIALPTTVGNCTDSNDLRPMGLGVRDGKVYVGSVCTAESTVSGLPIDSTAARKGDPGKLRAYVQVWDGATTFSPVVDFALNYPRGCLNNGGMGNCTTYGNAAWQAWTPAYPFSNWSTYANGYPQPMLSDIEFTPEGDMVLGFADRFGHMDGSYAVEPPSAGFSSQELTISGDVLHACKTGESTWVMEKMISGEAACSTVGKGYDANKQNTIDEYYFEDDMGTVAPGNHADVGDGGIGVVLGSGTIISSVMDPARNAPSNSDGKDPWQSHGLHWYDGITGAFDKGYVLVDQGQPNDQPVWGKGNGLGDVEVLYPPAPVEIGNRVWLDNDGDGIQDAGEAGIPNVTVKLLSGSGEIASAVTAADGTYYFSNAAGTSTASRVYGITQLQPNEDYTVRFPTAVTVSGADYQLTNANAGGNNLLDSNAPVSGDVLVSTNDIPAPGVNNHSFDVGYKSAPVATADLSLSKTVTPTSANRGDTVVYALTVTNDGPDVATGVQVTDKLPAGLTFVAHNGASPAEYDAGTGVWNVGTVGVGAANAVTLQITATVK